MSREIGGASGAGQALVVVLHGAIWPPELIRALAGPAGTNPQGHRRGAARPWPDSGIDRGRGHALACQGEIAADLWRPGQRRSELAGAAGSGGANAAPAAPGGPVTAMGREGRIRVMLGSPAR